jgi:hypothetical protein
MAKNIILLLIKAGLLTLSLDSQAKWEDWNNKDKTLFKMYVVGSTLDYLQSKDFKDTAYVEANPFLPTYPSSDRLLLQKLAGGGLIYWSLDGMTDTSKRKNLYIINGIQWGVVLRNEYIGASFKYNW